ncbi:MAG: dTDP-4-dehydrorhamnose reductase [Deltaproteobacteria bacterium]|nr:dTDP-4-dehydrorhamnose reductase [Deltaproteobacteria bacterium]
MHSTSHTGTARAGRMLITGANGLLGKEITRYFSNGYEVLPTDLAECDVTIAKECMRVVGGYRPEVVVHCAAYTAVDRAEWEVEAAFALNAGGTRNVALACREHRSLLVTFSTDYVFDGASERPYAEDDPTDPLSVYGRSKLAAEEAVREVAPDFLLLRTQWLFGAHGRSFVSSILERAERGEECKVVSDQKGSPTYTRDLAGAVRRLLDSGARGIFHFSNAGETSFFEFAAFLLANTEWRETPLTAISTSDIPRDLYPAPRPLHALLSKEKYRKETGVSPRRWEDAVRDFLQTGIEGGRA